MGSAFAYADAVSWVGTGINGANEDFAAVDADAGYAIVMDGASGLTPDCITGCPSDAVWFSHELGTRLEQGLRSGGASLQDILVQAHAPVASEFMAFPGAASAPRIDLPSAGIALARWSDDTLELAVLGDCWAMACMRDGSETVLYDTALSRLDGIAIDEMARISREEGVSMTEARAAINDLLIEHRLLRNRPSGYWVADIEGDGIDHLRIMEIPLESVSSVFLCSDGYAAATTMGIVSSMGELARKTAAGEGAQVLAELREAENADASMDLHPRFKASDDASFATVRFV